MEERFSKFSLFYGYALLLATITLLISPVEFEKNTL